MAARESRSRNPERRMSLGQHLVELRKRLFRAALAVVAGTVAGWFLYDLGVWNLLSEPITSIAESRGDDAGTVALNFNNITGGFEIHMQVAIVIGIVISSPIWLYQTLRVLRSRTEEQGEEVHVRLLLHRHPAVLRRLLCRLVGASAHRGAHGDLRSGRIDLVLRHQVLPRLRAQARARDRDRLRAARSSSCS